MKSSNASFFFVNSRRSLSVMLVLFKSSSRPSILPRAPFKIPFLATRLGWPLFRSQLTWAFTFSPWPSPSWPSCHLQFSLTLFFVRYLFALCATLPKGLSFAFSAFGSFGGMPSPCWPSPPSPPSRLHRPVEIEAWYNRLRAPLGGMRCVRCQKAIPAHLRANHIWGTIFLVKGHFSFLKFRTEASWSHSSSPIGPLIRTSAQMLEQ